MKKTVLFDLDGTLTDSEEGILKSVKSVLAHYGIDIPSDEALHAFIGPPLRLMFPRYGVPEAEVENAIKLYRSRYFTVGKFENRVYGGIPELLERLSSEGYRLCIATTKPEDLAIEILNHFGLARFFDRICGATPDPTAESKEKIIGRLFDSMGAKPQDAVMVGDTVYDILGAKEHGIPAVGVTWGYGRTEDMKAAGAVFLAETPDELYEYLTQKA